MGPLLVWRRERDDSPLRGSPFGPTCGRSASLSEAVEPCLSYIEGSNPRAEYEKSPRKAGFFHIWRRERDSNPRYGVTVYTLSRRAPSATRTSLQNRASAHDQLSCFVTTEHATHSSLQGQPKVVFPAPMKVRKIKPDGLKAQVRRHFAPCFTLVRQTGIKSPSPRT